MNLNRYTQRAGGDRRLPELAQSHNHSQIEPDHLLLALLQQESGVAGRSAPGRRTPTRSPGRSKATWHGDPRRTAATCRPASAGRLRVLQDACAEASQMKDDYVSTEHILLALTAADGGTVARLLGRLGVTRDRILAALTAIRGSQRVTSQNPEATYQALEKYGRDLTATAAGQARPGHRPGRGDSPHDPDPVAAHEEQPRAHRRARRGQDCHRGGPGATHRARGRA